MSGKKYLEILRRIGGQEIKLEFDVGLSSGLINLSDRTVTVEDGKLTWSTDVRPNLMFSGPFSFHNKGIYAIGASVPGSIIKDDELSELIASDEFGNTWNFSHVYPMRLTEHITDRLAITVKRAAFRRATTTVALGRPKYVRMILNGVKLKWLPGDQQRPLLVRLDGFYVALAKCNSDGTVISVVCPKAWITDERIGNLCAVFGMLSSRATYVVAEEEFDRNGNLLSISYFDRFNSERNSILMPVPWDFSVSGMDGTKKRYIFAQFQEYLFMCLYRGFSKRGKLLGVDVAYEHCIAAVGQSPAAAFGSYSIALEALVSSWSKYADTLAGGEAESSSFAHPTIVGKDEFAAFSKAVRAAILRTPGRLSAKGARKRLATEENILGLNRLGWMHKVENFFRAQSIEISSADKKTIRKRNDVFHNGRLSGLENEPQKEFLMQGRIATLVYRAMLATLGYRGPVIQLGEEGFPVIDLRSGSKLAEGGSVRLTDLAYSVPSRS